MVHCFGFFSGRQRKNLVPWRNGLLKNGHIAPHTKFCLVAVVISYLA